MSKITIELERDEFGNIEMLQKLKPGEPYWILRGQDVLAARTLRFWCREAEAANVNDEKLKRARAASHAVLNWPNKKLPD